MFSKRLVNIGMDFDVMLSKISNFAKEHYNKQDEK